MRLEIVRLSDLDVECRWRPRGVDGVKGELVVVGVGTETDANSHE